MYGLMRHFSYFTIEVWWWFSFILTVNDWLWRHRAMRKVSPTSLHTGYCWFKLPWFATKFSKALEPLPSNQPVDYVWNKKYSINQLLHLCRPISDMKTRPTYSWWKNVERWSSWYGRRLNKSKWLIHSDQKYIHSCASDWCQDLVTIMSSWIRRVTRSRSCSNMGCLCRFIITLN